ncbi:hypothetical protein ABT354_36760 [Streptomyces sp. NPDC000594]|uniref:hypothetical protein n=1 Tax=Streptomyces sp. NPDC000594 TaxID=3154261 RepID=UPI003318174A
MVLHPTRPAQPDGRSLVHHSGPPRRTLLLVLGAVAALLLTGCWLVLQRYNDRPPWAEDITYEAGYLHGKRVLQGDPTGKLTAELLDGGCVRMEAEGAAGRKATYNPKLWVTGCLDGAAGRPSAAQGLLP